jgi:hypothetical protein
VATLTIALFAAACVVLLAAGVSKLRDPRPTLHAALAIGLPASPARVRVFGIVEIVSALAGLFVGGACLAVAMVYAALTMVAYTLHRRAPSTPCGCLGAPSQPAGAGHVFLNALGALVAALAATQPAVMSRVVADPVPGLVLVALALCCARLAVLTLELSEVTS